MLNASAIDLAGGDEEEELDMMVIIVVSHVSQQA